MTSTFILDSAFLTDLSEFDGHCHTVPFRPAKTPDELPFAGLEHVARADATSSCSTTRLPTCGAGIRRRSFTRTRESWHAARGC
ncbi:MAG: hypothetical protein WDN72_01480 [Alphaproteobacteria bacterium]